MALDRHAQAAIAAHRFGLGPQGGPPNGSRIGGAPLPGSLAVLAADPRGALHAELNAPGAGQIDDPSLLSAPAADRAVFEYNQAQSAKQKVAQQQREAAQQVAVNANASREGVALEPQPTVAAPPPTPQPPPPGAVITNAETKARYEAARDAGIGFVERLAWFWSNHFCVSSDATIMAGGYEREAIRPHVLGRFVDMLQAAEQHPAMLVYLNNAQSIGPNSIGGINRKKGLNENLAREILELHTLGVRTGYTQDDVTRFANVITGWTTLSADNNPEHGSEFVFNARLHEPGAQTVLGKSYDDTGLAQGRAVLADLARHPATAQHIALKLARHFLADDPPPPFVARLARTFRDTDGDLKAMARALVDAPEMWEPQRRKLKRPDEWIVGAVRATGLAVTAPQASQAQTLLGEPLWKPPAPKGFSDDNAAWFDGLTQRLDIANSFAQRGGARLDPNAVAQNALGPSASQETLQTIARAEAKPQAIALLLMAPEFLRR